MKTGKWIMTMLVAMAAVVVLANSARAGDLTPPGPPGSTMHTLEEIYERLAVLEGCWDWYSSAYYSSSPGTDPRGPTTGTDRVLRGGSWNNYASSARCATRYYIFPDDEYSVTGIRCARGL
ncbi:MAG: SUMF1/EgtB/PvdO family nonheme iron enzyme [Verrucomicrobiota bacterium]|nr:SUMF1/EgtB/PvdO family nonheme iron enzyme [Verrucomicrobiota bacterium]